MSRVRSVEPESTTIISSAHETDSHAARMFSASLKAMMVAEILKALEDTKRGARASTSAREGRKKDEGDADLQSASPSSLAVRVSALSP
jgi:cytochrome c553